MVLVDTSVWVKHFRYGDVALEGLLEDGQVTCHPFIVGELACGNLKKRIEILGLLQALPVTTVASNDEVMIFIEDHRLMGKGLGFIGLHLLVSAVLSETQLWTIDKRLHQVSLKLGLAY